MENINALNDEAMENVTGGAKTKTNTTDWTAAHWQPTDVTMGTTFVQNGYLWYRIKSGDTLGNIAATFGTTVGTLKANNPATIKDTSKIYAGDAIIIRRA